ncbi:MAG: N-terminal methylation [Proteobacteria bacterium]|nr:N-terminal methylation [Pseudomonadota bacterium]
MKKAFTMLELVFVIVIVGILSYFVSSSFQRNPLREAADQVVSHIRYTQHLAMMDDKFDPNDATWYEKRWQIRFPHTTILGEVIHYYEVFRDENKQGNSNLNEEAVDPLTGKTIGDGVTAVAAIPDDSLVNLTKKYGITAVNGTCVIGGAYRTIAFDNIGRPYLDVYTGPYSNILLANDCNITLVNPDGNVTITVTKETGYTYISAQNY